MIVVDKKVIISGSAGFIGSSMCIKLLERGDELKLVHPQNGINPEAYEDLDFDNFYLQPMDGPQLESNTKHVIEFCRRNPIWKVSLQTHKLLDIP